MPRYFVLLSLLLGTTLAMAAPPARLSSRDRLASEGYALVRGPEFGIQIKLVETKPSPNRTPSLYVYDYVVTDNATGKIHGGRGKNRLEASVDDMHKPSRWQFRDLDGDGHTDFRYYKGDGKKSHIWWAEVWQPTRKKFMYGKEFAGK
ncbi:MAG: hypothetical protein LH470_04125 [Lysobacter sp.]|nr:hypothetical protein [Lysobacter sp.]